MSRTKGQIERYDFASLKAADLYALLSHSDKSSLALIKSFSVIEGNISGLYSSPEQGECSDLELANISWSIAEFPTGVLKEFDRRIALEIELTKDFARCNAKTPKERNEFEIARNASEKIAEIWRNLKKKVELLIEKSVSENIDDGVANLQSDPRKPVLDAYLKLVDKLGRRPFRNELEGTRLKLPSGSTQPRSISKSAQRLGLRLGDARIHAQLEKAFRKHEKERGKVTSLTDHLKIVDEVFSNPRIQSDEANRLRTKLFDSPFDRLLVILQNPEILENIEARVSRKTLYDGEEANYIEVSKRPNFKSYKLTSVASIVNSERTYFILIALAAFADLWHRTNLFAFDFTWIKANDEPDYARAVDFLFLSETLRRSKIGSAGAWLKWVAVRPEVSQLVFEIWIRPSIGDILSFAPKIDCGAKILLELFKSDRVPESPLCSDIEKLDSDFRLLIEFLSPFDILQKGEDYGFRFCT